MSQPDPAPPIARRVVDTYLRLVDAEAPGLVEGLYLTGSIALDDFRPDSSDVDFVAVTAGKPDTDETAALRRVHARLPAHPSFDGPYVTWSELAADPLRAEPGPHAHGGRLHPSVDHERHPVTWHTLADHGVTVRGPGRSTVGVHTDPAGLCAWTRGNLDTYWASWRRRAARPLSRPALACLGTFGPVWAVLGVARLHHTLATGRIIAKTAAGEYARGRFPSRWHPIIDEALRLRRGCGSDRDGRYRNPGRRGRDTLAFLEHVLGDAASL